MSDPRSITKIATVAWREFRHTALTPAFFFGAVVVPILMFGLVGLVPLMIDRDPPPIDGTFVVVDPTGEVSSEVERWFENERGTDASDGTAKQIDEALEQMPAAAREAASQSPMPMVARQGRIQIDVLTETDPERVGEFKEQLQRGDIVGLAIIDERVLNSGATTPGAAESAPDDRPKVEVFVPSNSSTRHTTLFRNSVRESVIEARVARTGTAADQVRRLMRPPSLELMRISDTGEESQENLEIRMLLPIGFLMLLWISTFTSGNYMLTTTIEEKSNKVMEVLLSAISPMQLMTGKIFGQAGVAAIMLVMYGGLGVAALFAFALGDLLPISLVIYTLLFFVAAFFMIATIMAAVGSAVSDLRDAQSLVGPAMMILMIPLFLWFPISQNPNGGIAVAASFIPPASPFVMVLRLTASTEPVPTWQILASLVVAFAAVGVMLWACARIFRVGVLMQGKPPSPLELLRWIRYQ